MGEVLFGEDNSELTERNSMLTTKKPMVRAMMRIVLPYVLIAGAWILFSNWLVNALVSDPADRMHWVLLKAWAFVLITGVLLAIQVYFQNKSRKRDEEIIRAQSLLLAITESTPDAIYIKDTQGRYVFVNAAACRIVGKSKEEVLGKDDRALFPAQEAHEIMESDRKVLQSGRARVYEETLSPRGESHTFLASKAPMRDSHGQIVGISGIVRDISERQQSARELQRVNSALRMIIDCNQAIIYATNGTELLAESCRIAVERGYRMAWVGMAENDEKRSVKPVAQAGFEDGYLALANISWAECERGQSPVGAAIRTGRPCVVRNIPTEASFAPWRDEAVRRGYASEIALPLSDEGRVWGSLNIYAASSDAFDPHEMELLAGLSADLAFGIKTLRLRVEHAQAERALRESERKYRELVEHANSIILRWNRDGRITFLNEFGQRFFGYSSEEILGRHVMETIVPRTESGGRDLNQLVSRICADPKLFEQNVNECIRRNGERVWISWTNKVVIDERGQVDEILSIGSDITERKQAEAEVRRLHTDLQRYAKELEERVRQRTAQLEASNKELEAFSYSVSHDLRAPLRSIDGWSHILVEDWGDRFDTQGRECLDRILSETQRMSRLIDDLLQLARVSRIEMHPIRVDLTALAETIAGRIKSAHPARPIEFLIQPALAAYGDPQLLEVVLTNLLDNACKFTGQRAQAKIEFGASEPGVFYVRDNGAGFDMSRAQKLFNAFQRMHSVAEFPGTGVGLATVLRIIQRHGGRVWAQAQVNQGATFFFTVTRTATTGAGGLPMGTAEELMLSQSREKVPA